MDPEPNERQRRQIKGIAGTSLGVSPFKHVEAVFFTIQHHFHVCVCAIITAKRLRRCLNEVIFGFDRPSHEQLTKQKEVPNRQSSENTEHSEYNKAIFPFIIKSSYKARAADVHARPRCCNVNTTDP